ncbi:NCS2 family permease [Endozoicomonas montiporae]|uniref:Guanine/hypoxanthine permease n=1 Tax=Endozoicomonas montiporae CL-33 TaxID=570277 RepID=A0A142B808_9GAMM|nr:NCS2 family permease [Endozoicomonas montiporae]AMO54884.1 guanine/hypoxanthine permease [Endozoicomonas montiporae CL-33]
MLDTIQRYFEFDRFKTNFRTEIMAGLTAFLAMSYILSVNPAILGNTGMDKGAVFTATALSAAFASLVMGIFAKYPIVLAPAMGMNALFTYGTVIALDIPWETALAGIFVSGVIFFLLSVTGVREKVIKSVPADMKYAVTAALGFFICFIGLRNAGIIAANPATLVQLGDVRSPSVLLALFGLALTIFLIAKGVKLAVFFGVMATTLVGVAVGLNPVPDAIVSAPPSLAPTFGMAIANLPNILTLEMVVVVITFLFIDFFDAVGTIIAVCNGIGVTDKEGNIPNVKPALFADAAGTIVGSVLGTSSVTCYSESAVAVGTGGRTGFTSVTTAACMLMALFFFPLIAMFTTVSTSPALIAVGVFMASSLHHIDWSKMEIKIPAFFTIIMTILSYSLVDGIAFGFTLYPVSMLAQGRGREVTPTMYVLSAIFVTYYFFL